MIIANSAPCASLAIYHLISNASSKSGIIMLIVIIIIKVIIFSIVIGLKNFYFPLIHLPSCYRTVCYRTVCYWTACYWTAWYRTVQQTNHIQSCSLNQPITFKVVVSITIETVYKLLNLCILCFLKVKFPFVT